MNSLTFHVTKVDEDQQGFIDEVFKVIDCMGVTSREKSDLDIYHLKVVEEVWLSNGGMRDSCGRAQ